MGQAVFEFFQTGGAEAYVVALQAGNYFDPTKAPPADDTGKAVAPATTVLGTNTNNFTFTALQPVGLAAAAGRANDAADHQQPDQGPADDDTADVPSCTARGSRPIGGS